MIGPPTLEKQMPQIQVKCPNCQTVVRGTAGEQQDVVDLSCRNCGRAIKVKMPKATKPNAAKPTDPLATNPVDPEDPLDFLSSPSTNAPGSMSRNRPSLYPGGGTAYGRPVNQRSKSNIGLILAIVAVAGVLFIAVVVGGLVWIAGQNGFLPDRLVLNGFGGDGSEGTGTNRMPKITWARVPRPESVDALTEELSAFSNQADQAVALMSESELQTIGADKLVGLQPEFENLFFRAVQATPLDLTMTEVAAKDAKTAAEIANLNRPGSSGPPKNYIWRLQQANDPADRWGRECYQISRAKLISENTLGSRSRFQNPVTETSGAFDWSAEDRRVLSAYWLQGELERDVTTELVACLREGRNVGQLMERCFVVVDKFYAPARELAAIPSSQGNMLINEPKGTAYARHAFATRQTIEELKRRFKDDEEVLWLLNMVTSFSDGIEELQFGRGQAVATMSEKSMREHYAAHQAMVEAKKQAELAEATRQQEEIAKQERARKAAEAAEVAEAEKQRQLAEAAQKSKEDSQNTANAGGNETTKESPGQGERIAGPGLGRPPRGIGSGSGDVAGGPANGPPRGIGNSGPPPGFGPPQGFGPPPGFGSPPGFGQPGGIGGHNAGPPGPGGPFPGGPPALGPSVTIRITGPNDMDVNSFLEKLKSALKTGNYRTSQSGGEATLTLGYEGDLQIVVDAIDFGTVESIDNAKRELRVKVQ